MANSTDQMCAIMDLKLNHQRECHTADLKIYNQLAYLKKHGIEKYFFKIHKSALDNVNGTIFKVQKVNHFNIKS